MNIMWITPGFYGLGKDDIWHLVGLVGQPEDIILTNAAEKGIGYLNIQYFNEVPVGWKTIRSR